MTNCILRLNPDGTAASDLDNPKNPNGWFQNSVPVDVTTPAGLDAFADHFLNVYIPACISVGQELQAQSFVFWFGGRMYPTVGYLGDMDELVKSTFAPELLYGNLISAIFSKLFRAGFNVGVCLRPTLLLPTLGSWHQTQNSGAATQVILASKVANALKDFNCSDFYIDSTSWMGSLQDVVYQYALAKNPHVRLFPEEWDESAYGIPGVCPYMQSQFGTLGTPATVRAKYPKACSIVDVGQTWLTAEMEPTLAANVALGDIIMTTGWYRDGNFAAVKRVLGL